MRMEALLDLYAQPYNPQQPVICLDERPCQLLDDKEPPLPMQPGHPAKEDYQYERQGTCCLFVAVEPLTGFRFVQVRKQRTKADYAQFLQALAALPQYTAAHQLHVVQDNLNTHHAGTFYEAFDAEVARHLARRCVSHPTPKHASWLNMAEIELAALSKQCLDRRIATQAGLEQEVLACVKERNAQQVKITWRFTTADARDKLKRHYETIKK
jgi:hypothetical protein